MHRLERLERGSVDLVVPNLVGGSQFIVTYLYYPPLVYSQINTSTECDEGLARVLETLIAPRLPKWQRAILWMLAVLGACTSLYLLFSSILYMLSRI